MLSRGSSSPLPGILTRVGRTGFLTEIFYTAVRIFFLRHMWNVGKSWPSEMWVHNIPVSFCAVASLDVKILSVLCYNCRPKKRKIGLCVACTVRVWETDVVSSLRSSYVQRFLSSVVSTPLMAVEMWMFGFGLAYCYVQNTDLVQVFRCALFRKLWHTEPVCELDIAFLLSCIFLRKLSPER